MATPPHQSVRPPARPPGRPREPILPPPRRPSQTPAPTDVITKQTLVGSVVLTALIATILTAFIVSAMVDKGPEGARGPSGGTGATGEQGPRGERGRTNRDVGPAALAAAITEDPIRFENALQEATGGSLSSGLDSGGDSVSSGDTTVFEDDIEALREELRQVCDAVRAAGTADTGDLPC